jgi:Fur family ferric uptake transcriptional regulator
MANKEKIDAFKVLLKKHELSVTQQRVAILSLLSKEHSCLGVDDLVTQAKKKKLEIGDWSTVFRTLKTFEESGLVEAFLSTDGVTRYELVSDEHHHHHHHFVCRSCKTVETLDECPTQIFEKAAKQIGFKVENHVIEVQGVCSDCQQKSR